MAIGVLEFEIKRGVIDSSDLDDEVAEVVNECIDLCKSNAHETAVEKITSMLSFEWSWSSSDGDPSEIVMDDEDIVFECSSENCSVQLGLDNDSLIITARVTFEAELQDGISQDDVQNWLDDNSAYACGYLSGGWSYASTDGDNVSIVEVK